MKSPYLTTAELAERWQVSVATVRSWRSRGTGPAYIKLGDGRSSEVRYHLDDIHAYEGGNRYAPAE
jgi:uncharacterized protein YjcR